MDFGLSMYQQDLLAIVDQALEGSEGSEGRAHLEAIAVAREYDGALDARLDDVLVAEELTLLDRVLIAERLAEYGASSTWAIRAIVAADVPRAAGPIALVDRSRSGLARYAQVASSALVFDGDEVRLIELARGTVDPVQSGSGYPMGRIKSTAMAGGMAIGGVELRSLWALAVAAEIAGLAAAAISRTATHLQQRKQFGKPLSQFQALRHRVAEAAVTAEATRWMVREAAYSGESRSMFLAASYAAACAAELSPEIVQLWGARGLAREFGVSTFAMRLQGLRLELGSRDRLALAVIESETPTR